MRSARVRMWGLAVALAIDGAIAGWGFADPRRPPVTVALVVGPFTACAVGSAATTFGLTAYALVLGFALALRDHALGTGYRIAELGVVLVGGAVATWLAVERAEREHRLVDVAAVAETAQRAILPVIPERVADLEVAARFVSATREAWVGGDLYELLATEHGVRVILGDAQGKGINAVRLSAMVLGAFREAAWSRSDLVEVAWVLDEHVQRFAEEPGDFVTAVLVDFTPDGAMRVVNCGHPDPVVLSRDDVRVLHASRRSLPLGLGVDPIADTHEFGPGDRVMLYTDGAEEARNAAGEYFDLVAGLVECLRIALLEECLDRFTELVGTFVAGEYRDDVALMVVERSVPVR
ncbi:MAG TPA: PP2C family protein-serine/threonine phosphatase [Acidimicrobiales bacterium]|nr:PP2C family protein-serine/threonine phosphatase [Acidimicrobiales bacterium]